MDYSLEELRERRLAALEKRQELQSSSNAAAQSQDEAVREPQILAEQVQDEKVEEPQISAGHTQDQALPPEATAAGLQLLPQLLNSARPVVSVPATTMNMVCIQAEDLYGFLKSAFGMGRPLQEVSAPLPKVEVSAPSPKVEVSAAAAPSEVEMSAPPSPLPGGEVSSPDVLFMGNSTTSSPTPDYNWIFNEIPAPVFQDVKEEPSSKRSTSPSWRRLSPQRKGRSSGSTSRPRSRSISPEYSFDKASKKAAFFWRSRSPASKQNPSCSASTSKPRSRSPSPDMSFLDFKEEPSSKRSTSPSWRRLSVNRKCSGSAATSRPRSRSPSPDMSFLDFKVEPSSKRSTSPSWRRLSPQRKGRSSGSTSRPKSRSPSPEYFFGKASKKAALSSWRSRSPASKQNPSCSASTSKPRSRSPSPDMSFLDFEEEPTSKRSTSPSWGRLSVNRKCSGSAATSRPRSRSSSPEISFDRDSKKPTFSSKSRPLATKPKPSFSASASQPRSRSSSPEFSFLTGSSTSKRRLSSQSRDPDYVPESKKLEPSKETKAPPKKRGRPPKSKEPKKEKPVGRVCPICKESEAGPWVNTPCGHIFHKECLSNWATTPGQILRTFKVCPSCGVDYDPDKVNPIYL